MPVLFPFKPEFHTYLRYGFSVSSLPAIQHVSLLTSLLCSRLQGTTPYPWERLTMPKEIETQTPDGPLPLLFQRDSNSSPTKCQADTSNSGAGDSTVRFSGGGGSQRRSLLLRLPPQRPQPLVTTKTSCGCHMYRPRTTCAALLMLSLGTLFLVLGLLSMLSSSVNTGGRGVSLIILGGIMFLPGSYATYILIGIWLQWDNFDGTMLPSYDEEEGDESNHI